MTAQHQLMVENSEQDVARRIAQELKKPGKTVEGMAAFADISVQAIYKWQRTGLISKQNLLKLAEYTGRQADYFLTGRESVNEPSARYEDPEAARLAHVIALVETSVPLSQYRKTPAKERAQAIVKLYRMTTPDGSIPMDEAVRILKRFKAK